MRRFRAFFILILFATLCHGLPRARAAEAGKLLGSLGVQVRDGKEHLLYNGAGQVQGYLTRWLIMELSVIYGEVEFLSHRDPALELRETGTRLRTPVLFRFPFLKYFSSGVGFYGSYRIGDVKSSAIVASDFQTSAHDTGEHGLEAALGGFFPISGSEFLIKVDFRSNYSLTARKDETYWWQQVVVGLQHPI